MEISGYVVDGKTKTPIEEAHVVITREAGGDEIATLITSMQGRFAFSDDLNEYLGQQFVFSVAHEGYEPMRSVYRAERQLVITLPLAQISDGKARLGLWERVRTWFQNMPPRTRMAVIAAPVAVAVLVVLAVSISEWPRGLQCRLADIRRVAMAEQVSLLWDVSEICRKEGNEQLRFAAIEQCASRESGQCLMTMANWYDPQQADQPSPFKQRNAVLATQYYRRARIQGIEEARVRLDALCRSLREGGGTAATEASC